MIHHRIFYYQDLRRRIETFREVILLETFVQLKQYLIRNVVRSQLDDILRLQEQQIEPLELCSDDIAPFNLLQQANQADEQTANYHLKQQSLGVENKPVPSFEDIFAAFGSTQAMDIVFQTTECPRFNTAQTKSVNKSWSDSLRPYVWDLIATTNQSYIQLVQAAADTYLKQRHFVIIYA